MATLGYLAAQIRQNTKAVKASSHHSVTDSFNHLNSILGTNVAAARVFRLGMEDLGNLDEDEQFSFAFMALAYMRVFETLYYQREHGTLEEQLYQSEHNSLNWAFGHRGMRDWWNSNTISFSPEFRAHVRQVIQDLDAAAQQGAAADVAQRVPIEVW